MSQPLANADTLGAFLDAARACVDDGLERFLPKPPACPAMLSEAMRYSLFAGGKRLRPVLTLAAAHAAAQAGSGAASDLCSSDRILAAVPAACAIEMIHTYSLIHDDLPAMDDDTLRRGRPTLHVVYGDGLAILAGDGLQAEAFALLGREPVGDDPPLPARKLRALRLIADASGAAGMVGGQTLDLQAAGQAGARVAVDADGLRAMHARKTGALITAAAASGAVMAGGDDALVASVSRYAAQLGIAFQIIDDVLDVEGDAATLGKTAGKDRAADKPTYPALYGVQRSRALAAACVEEARSALTAAGLMDAWLWPIAEWMLARSH